MKVIDGGREDLVMEFRETLMEFVMYDGAAQEQAKKKLYEIDDRLSRRADLRLITEPSSSATSVSPSASEPPSTSRPGPER